MTANSSANTFTSFLTSLGNGLRSAYRLIGRIALGGLAIIAAGIVALTMTFLGVLIALAALIMRLTRGVGASPQQKQPGQSHQESAEGGVILEARKTGEGWTVE